MTKKIKVGTISGKEAIIKRKNKPNVIQNPELSSGTGVWEDKKKYKRSRDKKRAERGCE